MQLFLRSSATRVVDVPEDMMVEAVYQLVAAREGVAADQLYLVNQGRVLTTGTLAANGLAALSMVDVSVRIVGGKVHGSLARAGKVKGQTPKMEKKADKTKPKTGRCKRRLQYNKRFVNVVVGLGGKKKGPNTQAVPT